MDIQAKIRDEARKLLADKQVDVVIGYEDGDAPLQTTPGFITDPNQVDRLVWNRYCHHNLTNYLIGRKDKVAVIAKACDTRTIAVLLHELQLTRDNLTIIGVPCGGIVDYKKIHNHLKGREVIEADTQDDTITVKGDGFNESLKISDFLADCCLVCRHRNPLLSDITVGEEIPETEPLSETELEERLDKMTADQRWAFFEKEFSRCIRCYACREACPLCYCKQCFVDQSFPEWIGKSTNLPDTMAFHIMRSLHTAGRCTGCGACARACPHNIAIRLLTRRIEKDTEEMFGVEAGLDPEKKAPLTTYQSDDPQEFIK